MKILIAAEKNASAAEKIAGTACNTVTGAAKINSAAEKKAMTAHLLRIDPVSLAFDPEYLTKWRK